MGEFAEPEIQSGAGVVGGARKVYCLVPYELAEKLHEPLREHFREDPAIEVVVEQRRRERRSGAERRLTDGESPTGEERRLVLGAGERRVGERRAPLRALAPEAVPALPRRARRYAERLVFVERAEPSGECAEDLDTARVVARVQAGDSEAFATLYTRYFERVYGYLRVVLKDRHEAEDLTQQVFMQVLEALPRYERRRQPFRAFLFVVARNAARDHLAKQARIELMDTEELNDRRERAAAAEFATGAAGEAEAAAEATEAGIAESLELTALDWIRNQDLLILVERLPGPQRQVLTLRYMLGLRPQEIAEVMGIDPNHVSVLHYRAVGYLRERLTALGREPSEPKDSRDRARMTRIPQKNTVLRLRRFALDP